MKNIYDLFTFGLQRRHMRTKMQEKANPIIIYIL